MRPLDWLRYYRYNPAMLPVAWREWRKRRGDGRRLGVAVVGLGGGGLMHLSHYLWHPQAKVRALLSPDRAEFERARRRFPFMDQDVLTTTDFDEALMRPEVEAVSVAAPDHLHAHYALRALEAGKHVLCEKPLATTAEDCIQLVRAVRRTGRVLMAFQQMRFVPLHQQVKQLLQSGELGHVFYASCGYVHDMRKRATEFSRWRLEGDQTQHPILGGCHHIDLLRWLVGEIVEVHTVSNHIGAPEYPLDDCYVTALRFSNGAVGEVLTAFAPRVDREYHPLHVYATRGTYMDGRLVLERSRIARPGRIAARGYTGVPDFRATISAFVESILNRTPPPVTVEDGARTVLACLAAIESSRRGVPVSVPRLEAVLQDSGASLSVP